VRWVKESIGSGAAVTAVRQLQGATSSTLYALQVVQGRTSRPYILRLFTNQEWLREEPDLAKHEAANLCKASAAGVPVPELVAYDPDGDGCGLPAILMTCLPGTVVLAPDNLDAWLRQMAEVLIPLHSLDPAGHPWAYAPYNDPASLTVPTWSRFPELWARAIEIVNGPWPATEDRFIHRDYHPNNVLWQDGRLSGVVDWPNACRGPAGIDVAWCRANLKSTHGVAVADRFLDFYCAAAGSCFSYDPFWDLMVIIEGLPGPPDVYPPWVEFGLTGLTDELMLERSEAYLVSVMDRF
jgi:aminoglycoside phosphotransferase (APT) family kinase protein